MGDILLFTHSWLRWIVLLMGLFLIVSGFIGMSSGKDFTKGKNGMSAGFVGLFHLQLVIGLLLYFVFSPITEVAFSDFGAAMKNSELRFWAVEHILVMVLAAVVAQIGRIKIKKAETDKAKFKAMAVYFTIALVLVLSRIPWSSDRLGF
ncbi:MAG: hypothetical protein OEW75_00645 [Cyclobacteriaceae bacterium]|nr:hypothetical protein [Cyclobacteriaceae bacterium]